MGKTSFDGTVSNEWQHFIQTDAWAHIKTQSSSWKTHVLEATGAPLYVYSRSAVGFGNVHYLPKVAKLEDKHVATFTKNIPEATGSGVAIKLELDQLYSESLDKTLRDAGWLPSPSIQYEETVLVDLTPENDAIFKSFKKRARWELNAAMRRGATVERVECTDENMDTLFDMLKITAERGNFMIRSKEFHQSYWKYFAEQGLGFMYMVKHEDDILSAAYVMRISNRAYYKDGASVRLKSELFASRLMHWQIIQDMKADGANTYDMCGVMNSAHTDDRNRGITTFKTGFAPVVRLQGCYTLPLSGRFKWWQKFEGRYVALYFKLKKDLWY